MSDFQQYNNQPPAYGAPPPAYQPPAQSFSEGFGQQAHQPAPAPAPAAPPQAQHHAQQPPAYGSPQAQVQSSGYQAANTYGGGAPASPGYSSDPGRPSGGYSSSGGFGGGRGAGGSNPRSFGKPPLTPQELQDLRLPKTAVLMGNYNANETIQPLVHQVADYLRSKGFKIRVEPSKGFGAISMQAAGRDAEVYIPFKGFENIQTAFSSFNGDECKEFTRRYVPDFGSINEKQHSFYFRNTRLVLGKNCTAPAQVSIIWSDDGVESASTRTPKSGHAGHVALLSRAMNIPVFNLNNPGAFDRLKQYLEG